MSKVFISYSHTDKETADVITRLLEDLGIDYFRDVKEIEWGDAIVGTVRQGLIDAIAIIVIVSPGSLKSQWVAYETGFATALHKRILPYLTHPSLDLPVFMSDLSFIDSPDKIRDYFTTNPVAEITPADIDLAATVNTPAKEAAKVQLTELYNSVDSLPLDSLLSRIVRFAQENKYAELERWARLELNGYYGHSGMTETDVVPEYREISGEYYDEYRRPLVIDDPKLQFINSDRLRQGAIELMEYSRANGYLSVRIPTSIKSIRENLGVEVTHFRFSPTEISAVISRIRSVARDRLHDIKTSQEAN